ncbi:MAG: glycoside hydrolase [Clostridium sp.]|nr:glycoside hydrolase [Clostridium sp.]
MKKKFLSRALAAVMAMTCAVSAFVSSQFAVTAENGVKYEFEDGNHPDSKAVEDDNASGGKYVYLENNSEVISVNANVESTGMYDIYICYAAPYGNKIQNLVINGVDQGQISFTSEEWTEVKTLTAKLNAGDNEITIKGSWGWTNFDYVRVEPAELPDITGHDRTLSDPQAIDSAQRVMAYLGDVYGKHVLSGQQEIYQYGPHNFEYEFNYIKEKTGELPAIRGFDFLNCANILYGSEDGTVDRMIDWVNNKNGIVTASWHVTVPKNFADYNVGDKIPWDQASYSVWADDDNNTHTKPITDFDTAKVLEEGTKENQYYMACLEALAEQIQKLQDADVPLIFRPLHEAEGAGGEDGSWFWWGKNGSAVYKELWKLTYKTLTEKYDLHNIIWEWNSYAYDTSADWYPGDEYVDLIAYDKYNCTVYLEENGWQPSLVHNDSAISGTFYNIVEKYNGKKMVAMAENDSIPTLNNLLEEKAAWLYFCPWYDGGSDDTNFLSNPMFNRVEDLIEIYQSDYCITLDELPDLKTYESGTIPDPKPTEPSSPTEPPVTSEVPSTSASDIITTVTKASDDPVSSSSVNTTVTASDKPDVTTPDIPDKEIKVPDGAVPTQPGDIDLDGKVVVADLVALNKFLLAPEENMLGAVQLANADCIKNGLVNQTDSTCLLNYLSNQIKLSDLGKP